MAFVPGYLFGWQVCGGAAAMIVIHTATHRLAWRFSFFSGYNLQSDNAKKAFSCSVRRAVTLPFSTPGRSAKSELPGRA